MKVLCAIIMLLPMFLVAQQYQLDDLITHGLQNSFSLQKSELSSASTASSLNSAKWNLLPDASLNGGIKKDFDPVAGGDPLSSSAGFSLSKTISLNDDAYFNYRYASLDRDTEALRLNKAKHSYAYEVFSAYIEVLNATRQRSSLQENMQIQTRVWEQSKVMLQLGKNTPFDVKQNEIAVLNSNIAIMQFENTINNARSRLFALVQMSDEGWELADLEPNLELQIPSVDLAENSDIILLHQELKRNELEIKRDKLDNFPRVNLAYNFDRTVSGADFDFDRYNTNHGVTLSLSYPLLNHFKNSESSSRTKISRRVTQLNIDEKSDQILRDYNSAVQELQYLKRMNELYSERLAQSREQITQAEERYRLGLIELLELDKTRTEYIDATIAYNANRYQIVAKQEAINHLLSKPILGKW